MIANYDFIDGNIDGIKERRLTATTELYNKLSAAETNAIRDKINEVIGAINLNLPPLFSNYILKYKASGNTNQLLLEVGDIVGFFDKPNMIYLGGGNFEAQNLRIDPQIQSYAGVSTFTLPDNAIVNSVMLVRGILYEIDEWTQSGNILTITKTMVPGNRIQINFY